MDGYYANTVSRRCGFIRVWKKIVSSCVVPFKVLAKKPQGDLGAVYNYILSELCDGHERVYEMTTSVFTDTPSLGQAKDGEVHGRDELATQALVVLYLVRDFITAQAKTLKELPDDVAVAAYVRAFERFTVGVNCFKCCFTYHHWVWLKWGIPHPHTIPSTELMALVMWTETVLHDVNQEKLKKSLKAIVHKARNRERVPVEEMESVKRLSMSLSLLPDTNFYTYIVEVTYNTQLADFYSQHQSPSKNPEKYVKWVELQLKREVALACCFVHSSSYKCIRQRLLDVLLMKEKENLAVPVRTWLKGGYNASFRQTLAILDHCVMKGTDRLKSWFREMIQISISEEFQRIVNEEGKKGTKRSSDISFSGGGGAQSSAAAPPLPSRSGLLTAEEGEEMSSEKAETRRSLCAARTIFNYFYRFIKEVLRGDSVFLQCMLDELHNQVISRCCTSTLRNAGTQPFLLLSEMVHFAVEEVVSNYSGVLDREDFDPDSLWIASLLYKRHWTDLPWAFYPRYILMLQERLLSAVYTEKDNVEAETRREMKIVRAFLAKGLSFDFVSRCISMIEDVHQNSPKLWDRQGKYYPLVLRSFSWEIPKHDNFGLIGIPSYHLEKASNFLYSYSLRFPGLGVKFYSKLSAARVAVTNKPQLKLVVGMDQLSVLLLFNQKRVWSSPSEMAAALERQHGQAGGWGEEVCVSTVSLLAAHHMVTVKQSTLATPNKSGGGAWTSFTNAEVAALSSFPVGLINWMTDIVNHRGLRGASGAAEPAKVRLEEGDKDGSPASGAKKLNQMAVDAQVVRILKEAGALPVSELKSRLSEAVAGFEVPRKDVKLSVERLIEKAHVQLDTTTNMIRYTS